MVQGSNEAGGAASSFPALRAFASRDFRLLWAGAFISFVGSWVQNVAQGWLIYDLTRDPEKLALVGLFQMLPVTLLGPFAGTFADRFNKRYLLAGTQIVFAANAAILGSLYSWGTLQVWHIYVGALCVGIAGTMEVPGRQSIVSRVVPPEDLSAAVPLNAMTFNFARIVGPSIGGWLLATWGVSVCYWLNAFTYLGLIGAALAIRADLSSRYAGGQPVLDLVLEGMRFTLRDRRLKTLFLMECAISVFALFYLNLMPAIARDVLGLGKQGLGTAMTMIGFGAISALIMVLLLSQKPIKGLLVKSSMIGLGLALMGLSLCRSPGPAFICLFFAGFFAITQFNTTNTLFQLLSPDRLRGRVIAMHVWALSGIGPVGIYGFGWLAKRIGLAEALATGATLVLISAALAIWKGDPLREVAPHPQHQAEPKTS
ncbi:MAG TPA: MFS transporter [Fimbriimonadaceae bacterium]|nr:MFS transporter [Fimbriimonadaceae bacterium]HRJ32162.1 MFS transporter [Fimbriimonadaceae bacterium]